jgi:hypothetical protein
VGAKLYKYFRTEVINEFLLWYVSINFMAFVSNFLSERAFQFLGASKLCSYFLSCNYFLPPGDAPENFGYVEE